MRIPFPFAFQLSRVHTASILQLVSLFPLLLFSFAPAFARASFSTCRFIIYASGCCLCIECVLHAGIHCSFVRITQDFRAIENSLPVQYKRELVVDTNLERKLRVNCRRARVFLLVSLEAWGNFVPGDLVKSSMIVQVTRNNGTIEKNTIHVVYKKRRTKKRKIKRQKMWKG